MSAGRRDYFSRGGSCSGWACRPTANATVVHPSVVLPPSCQVGPGSVLLAGVVATTSVRIGAHVAVEAGVVLCHDGVELPADLPRPATPPR